MKRAQSMGCDTRVDQRASGKMGKINCRTSGKSCEKSRAGGRLRALPSALGCHGTRPAAGGLSPRALLREAK